MASARLCPAVRGGVSAEAPSGTSSKGCRPGNRAADVSAETFWLGESEDSVASALLESLGVPLTCASPFSASFVSFQFRLRCLQRADQHLSHLRRQAGFQLHHAITLAPAVQIAAFMQAPGLVTLDPPKHPPEIPHRPLHMRGRSPQADMQQALLRVLRRHTGDRPHLRVRQPPFCQRPPESSAETPMPGPLSPSLSPPPGQCRIASSASGRNWRCRRASIPLGGRTPPAESESAPWRR